MAATNQKPFPGYKDTEISTANQGKLIVMLYDGAIRFLRIAIENMEPRSYDVVNTNIIKSQDIVTELMISLNTNEGGEIADNLFAIYAYMKKRLLEGNIAKDTAILEEVVTLLEQLKGAWDQVSSKEIGNQKPSSLTEIREQGASFSIQG